MTKKWMLPLLLATSLSLSACSSLPSWMGGEKKEKEKLAGERIAVLPANALVQPDDTLKATAIKLPSVTKNEAWAQHSGNVSAETGNLAVNGFDTLKSATAGDGNSYDQTLVIRPVVGGGMVFAMDAEGNISAHDAADISQVRWHSKGLYEEDEADVLGGGLAYDSGKLYAISSHGMVIALDAATGKEVWHKTMHVPFRSAPKVAGNKLFAVTLDNQLYALNTENGDVAWNHRGISETAALMNAVSPAIAGDAVIVPYSSGEIYVLAVNDGREIWSDSLSSGKRTQGSSLFSGIGGDPVVDGAVVFNVSSGGMVTVQALATGQHVWERPIGSANTPWVAGDTMFLLTTDNILIAFAKFDGRIRWSLQLTSYGEPDKKRDPITWKGPVLVNDKLAVISSKGQLVLVNAAEGKVEATKEVPEDIYNSPVVAGGVMYFVGQDATLYSLQ